MFRILSIFALNRFQDTLLSHKTILSHDKQFCQVIGNPVKSNREQEGVRGFATVAGGVSRRKGKHLASIEKSLTNVYQMSWMRFVPQIEAFSRVKDNDDLSICDVTAFLKTFVVHSRIRTYSSWLCAIQNSPHILLSWCGEKRCDCLALAVSVWWAESRCEPYCLLRREHTCTCFEHNLFRIQSFWKWIHRYFIRSCETRDELIRSVTFLST